MSNKKNKREVQTVGHAPQNKSGEVDSFISQAIEQKAPVETLERLFALRTNG